MLKTVNRITECRQFKGEPAAFWPLFANALAELSNAVQILFIAQSSNAPAWKPFCAWPEKQRFQLGFSLDSDAFKNLAAQALDGNIAQVDHAQDSSLALLVFELKNKDANTKTLAVLAVPRFESSQSDSLTSLLLLAADTPAIYQKNEAVGKADEDVQAFSQALDLLAVVNSHEKFLPAIMALCNEAAHRFHCGRVSLGWKKAPYIRLKAISDMDRFERSMEMVQQLESVMEEAFDQDEEILFPSAQDATYISRDHEQYARTVSPHLLSIPIRFQNEPTAVITLEREDKPFTQKELYSLRILIDQASPRLVELEKKSRWVGARMAKRAKESCGKLIGFENTFLKLLGLIGIAALVVLIIGRWDYRIEADFIVKSDTTINLPAPFDGYIKSAPNLVGDQVQKGQALVELDESELLLNQASILSEIENYQSQRKEAEYSRELARMRAASAAIQEAEAKLEIIKFRLARATLKAPDNGIIIESNLRELIGSPVKSGEVLMRLGRTDALYIEMKVHENDVHEILESSTGKVVFASSPEDKHAIALERIEPVAKPDKDGNYFKVRAYFAQNEETQSIQSWWRPGMTGVAKIDVEERSLWWVATHRLVDFIRMKFWF